VAWSDEFDSEDLDPEGPDEADLARFGGDTRTCPTCGGEVHDLADQCPACGRWIEGPEERRHAAGGWRASLVWLAILSLAGIGWVLLRLLG